MKIQFESALDYQAQAIESVAGLFAGQEVNRSEFTVTVGKRGNMDTLGLHETDLGIGNRLALLPEEVHQNLTGIQLGHGLAPSPLPLVREFTVEMETGTGKTYVYLRSAFELHRRYGFTKFVIVVPSIAIKEGVLKSLEMTGEHFGTLYPGAKGYSYYAYDSAKLANVKEFATSSNLRFLVATIQSLYSVQEAVDQLSTGQFSGRVNRAERVIHREHEATGWEKPIDLIRATNPVLIVDEPQSVYGDAGKVGRGKGRQALNLLNPLCVLRYSATPLDRTQMLYRLDAVDAYEQKLVKGIEVASMQVQDGQNKPYVRVVEIKDGTSRKGPSAVLELDVQVGKSVSRRAVMVQKGDSLEEVSGGRSLYHDIRVGEIRAARSGKQLTLLLPAEEKHLQVGEEHAGINPDDLARAMIARTITEHLEKELHLRPKGIKVLSLFFIDRVENYRSYDSNGDKIKGKYASIFEEEYEKQIKMDKYKPLLGEVDKRFDASDLHDGYFGIDKKGRWQQSPNEDSGERVNASDRENAERAYNLIMRDKEKLLELETPLKFIFSHSALREGWDNPNVFQICVLREVGTERERRQTIGRGLRLAVNQSGERVRDDGVNTLTVIANERYEDFAENLQKEIEEDLGIKFGVVEPDQFAAIPVTDAAGQVTPLGTAQSATLHTFLRQTGYLNTANKVEDQLRRDLKAGSLKLPETFEPVRDAVTAILKKMAGRVEVKNANVKNHVQPNRAVLDDPEFRELWERISARTTYEVKVDTDELVRGCVDALNTMPVVPRTKVQTTVVELVVEKSGVSTGDIRTSNPTTLQEGDLPLPDLLGALQDRTQLTRRTLSTILRQTNRLNDFKRNPQAFIETVSAAINERKVALLIKGINYRRTGEYYAMSLLNEPISTAKDLKELLQVRKGAYDHVITDSSVEEAFAQELEANTAVRVYAKLPDWFTIPTPMGTYNPDWAILMDHGGREKLCFVAETKGTLWTGALKAREHQNIECGRAHFAVLAEDLPTGTLQYDVVTNIQDLFNAVES